jgi:hypothetical protein
MRFEQPVPMLPPVLAPGSVASAGIHYRITADSRRRWWSVRVSASGWERITVPAGAYPALRIDRQIAFEHPDLFKLYATHSDTLRWGDGSAATFVPRIATARTIRPRAIAEPTHGSACS